MSQAINIVVQLTGLFATVTVPAVQLPGEGGGPVSWEQVTSKPSSFPPSAHEHVMDDVQGLINALAGKAASVHEHEMAQVIGLIAALADKANLSQLADKADLVGGVIPTEQIPAIAITEFLGDVASEAAMLALVGQKGDWCIRTDQNRSYVIVGNDPTSLASWRYIETPGSPVTSVNGQTGTVVIGKASVGLGNVDNTSDANKPVSTPQAAALAGKSDTGHEHTASDVSDFEEAVLATVFKPFEVGGNESIATNDSIYKAFQKTQGQINARATIAALNAVAAANKRIVQVNDSSAVTGTTTNTLVRSVLIPANTFAPGMVLRIRSRTRKTGSGGTYTQRIYHNTTADLTGANLIGTHTSAVATQLYNQMRRDLVIKSSTVSESTPGTPSMSVDEAQQAGACQQYNIDWTQQQYILFSIQLGNGADSALNSYVSLDAEINTI